MSTMVHISHWNGIGQSIPKQMKATEWCSTASCGYLTCKPDWGEDLIPLDQMPVIHKPL